MWQQGELLSVGVRPGKEKCCCIQVSIHFGSGPLSVSLSLSPSLAPQIFAHEFRQKITALRRQARSAGVTTAREAGSVGAAAADKTQLGGDSSVDPEEEVIVWVPR